MNDLTRRHQDGAQYQTPTRSKASRKSFRSECMISISSPIR